MSKDEWRHTHNGSNSEALYLAANGKYYTRFAWDHFCEAYAGAVTPVVNLPRTILSWREGGGTSVWDFSDVQLDLDLEDTQPGPGPWTPYVPATVKDGKDGDD